MADEPDDRALEAESVRTWRVACGLALGLEWADAVKLADSEADMHKAADLIDHGATPEQALRILA